MLQINAAQEDWDLLLSFLPPNWKQLAQKAGAIQGLRRDKSEENYLRVLLMHLGCGLSLRETVVRAQEAHLANLSDVALLTLLYAEYVMGLTTFPESEFPVGMILQWYRFRWQIELVFKRFKQIAQLGHVPQHDPDSARAWLYGKLFVALLTEKLIQQARALSPWGYELQRVPQAA